MSNRLPVVIRGQLPNASSGTPTPSPKRCGGAASASSRHFAERWRSERWDSLVANGPAWHDRFPGMEFADTDPDGFAAREAVTDYFVA